MKSREWSVPGVAWLALLLLLASVLVACVEVYQEADPLRDGLDPCNDTVRDGWMPDGEGRRGKTLTIFHVLEALE